MSLTGSLSDFELQQLFAGGDQAYAKIPSYACLSEDAAQDVFLKLWNKREQLKDV